MSGKFMLYPAPAGSASIQLPLHGRMLLTQRQLGDVYESGPQNIAQHISAGRVEGELIDAATCKLRLPVRVDAGRQVSRSH